MALHPSLRAFLLAPSAILRVSRAASADRAAVLSLIAEHEGPESAELAALWWDQDPSAWLIVRDRTAPASSSLRAAMALAALPAPGGPLDVDPAVVAARIRLGRHSPVRAGERVTYVRWWLDAETYQMPSPAQTLLAAAVPRSGAIARSRRRGSRIAVQHLPATFVGWAPSCHRHFVGTRAAHLTAGRHPVEYGCDRASAVTAASRIRVARVVVLIRFSRRALRTTRRVAGRRGPGHLRCGELAIRRPRGCRRPAVPHPHRDRGWGP
jgi:hypothetical protein